MGMDAIMINACRTLVIAAHPDDLELWCGATLASFVEKGAVVQPLIVAQQREGQRSDSGAEVGDVRRAEAERGAAILGVEKPIFLPNYIGQLDVGELVEQLEMAVAKVSPEQIFTHYPLDEHPDHAIVGMAAYIFFLKTEGVPLYFFITPGAYSYMASHRTKGNVRTKRSALMQHVSQGFNREDITTLETVETYVQAHRPWAPGRWNK
jgi:hypothetical protein